MKNNALNVCRWILILPISALAAWVAYAMINLSWQVIVPSYGFMSSLRSPIRAAIEFFASSVMGAAFSWASFYVAPVRKKLASHVCSVIAAGLALISCGIALSQGNIRAIIMTIPLLIGLAWACYAIADGEKSVQQQGADC